jgi:hypothetical protein
MRGIHPHPFSHPFKRAGLNEQLNKKHEELTKQILPEINVRKLDDLLGEQADNPFRVQKTSEKLLVFREKQREIEKLNDIKSKIEHKYLYGQDLVNNLSKVGSLGGGKSMGPAESGRELTTDRTGMIREVSSIPE